MRSFIYVTTATALMASVFTLQSPLHLRTAEAQAAPACSDGTLVNTGSGPICGLITDGVTAYLGVPFAAPPVGAQRWRPPAPTAPWTTTLQATQAGLNCPQPAFPPGSTSSAARSEDCLTLNMYVPRDAGPGLPVMVEIHGGGFLLGAPPNGTHLAAAGRVIMVSIHYRLGILGFLAHKAFGEHSGDYGLLDQQAALRWVRSNISRFGGDPNNVTLFGQSAGGASVCDAAVSPTAAGLFQKGISESAFYNYNVDKIWSARGDCKSELLTEAEAEARGAAFAAKVGCGSAADVASCLRAVPAQTLVENGGQILAPDAGGTIGPTLNTTTLPISPAKAFITGRLLNTITMMMGVARDEFNGGLYTSLVAHSPDDYRTLVQQQFADRTAAVLERYPVTRFASPFIAYRTVMADAFSVCPALLAEERLARHLPVYAFENDNGDTPQNNPTLPLGAFHNAENPFLFPSPTLTLTPNQAALGDQIVAQWSGFARTGNPAVNGAPRWTLYANERLVMSLVSSGASALIPAATLNTQHNCSFWNDQNRTAAWSPR
jgi:para-nitrobenzyl esterase